MKLRRLLPAVLLCLGFSGGAQPPEECGDLRRSLAPPNADRGRDLGILITPEMVRCAQQTASKDEMTAEDSVEFVLTMNEVGEGIEMPPPQRLRVPVRFLEPLNPTAQAERNAISARGVSLTLPSDSSRPAEAQDGFAMGISITASGWQARVRSFTDPDFGGRPHYRKGPPDASGLRPLVSEDATKYETPFENVYVADEPELGFVQVVCQGFPERGPLTCRVSTELSPYLIVSVYLPEPELARWRGLTLAAHEVVRTLLLSE